MALITCPECGREVSDRASACPHCGFPLSAASPAEADPQPAAEPVPAAKPPKKKTLYVCIAVVAAVVVIFAGVYIYNANARSKYIRSVDEAAHIMLSGGVTADFMCSQVSDIWHDAIYDDYDTFTSIYRGSDFNDAIHNFYSGDLATGWVSEIIDSQSDAADLFQSLSSPPHGCDEYYAALSDLYSSFLRLSNLALSPTGNYDTYTAAANECSSDFDAHYLYLGSIIPAAYSFNPTPSPEPTPTPAVTGIITFSSGIVS